MDDVNSTLLRDEVGKELIGFVEQFSLVSFPNSNDVSKDTRRSVSSRTAAGGENSNQNSYSSGRSLASHLGPALWEGVWWKIEDSLMSSATSPSAFRKCHRVSRMEGHSWSSLLRASNKTAAAGDFVKDKRTAVPISEPIRCCQSRDTHMPRSLELTN